LVFQPPSGLGEWFVSLRNAAGVALALRRTLVVPHMLWDGSIGARAHVLNRESRLLVAQQEQYESRIPPGSTCK